MYLALYRKYRPKTFDDVISQPHITTTLKNQIITGKTAHAYLFTGSRGTGKTSCAKILSMALNCLHPINGSPCMECAACREIENGSATDIVEMDAASNNSVDDVRVLRDEVAYTPVSCKYRVYIIDEVHMLSINAFNALLKTLEEPPAHVVFILATTELHKVPATILSRCQRFEFKRIDIADSAQRLTSVAKEEGVTLTQDAAELISRLSDGGMRDALSVLDRCIAADKNITSDLVRECAGVADNHHLFAFAEMTSKKDVSGCIRLLSELHKGSKDIARLIDELSGHYRDLMLFKTVPQDKDLLTALPDEYGEIERIAGLYSLEEILRCLTLLQQCADAIGKTKQRKTLAEMCLVKMCLSPAEIQPRQAIAPQTQAAKPAQTVQIQTPPLKPIDQLSPEIAASLKKAQSIAESVKPKPANQPAPAAPISAAPQANPAKDTVPPTAPIKDAAPPEYNIPEQYSTPAPPDAFPDIPPIADEPPPVFDAPPREFETAPVQEEKPEPSVPPLPVEKIIPTEAALPAPKAETVIPAEKASENAIPQPETAQRLTVVTAAEWKQALSRLKTPLYSTMLINSSASVGAKGQLQITSDNMLLIDFQKTQNLSPLEEEISEALGKKVHIEIVCIDLKKTTAEDENPAVKLLLEKAKQLNIEIITK